MEKLIDVFALLANKKTVLWSLRHFQGWLPFLESTCGDVCEHSGNYSQRLALPWHISRLNMGMVNSDDQIYLACSLRREHSKSIYKVLSGIGLEFYCVTCFDLRPLGRKINNKENKRSGQLQTGMGRAEQGCQRASSSVVLPGLNYVPNYLDSQFCPCRHS